MKKALSFAFVVVTAITLILVSPFPTGTTGVQVQMTDIDAPGGG